MALRALIDSMVFDAIASEDALLARVDRLTRARDLQLLAAPASLTQIEATPDPEHRRRLRRVRVLVVPPAEADPRMGPLIDALHGHPGVDEDDARIAAAAAAENVALVTEDRALRLAVAAEVPELSLWDWASGLGPRLAAL